MTSQEILTLAWKYMPNAGESVLYFVAALVAAVMLPMVDEDSVVQDKDGEPLPTKRHAIK